MSLCELELGEVLLAVIFIVVIALGVIGFVVDNRNMNNKGN